MQWSDKLCTWMKAIFTRVMLIMMTVCTIWTISRTKWKCNTKESNKVLCSHYWCWIHHARKSSKWKSSDSLNGKHSACLHWRKTNYHGIFNHRYFVEWMERLFKALDDWGISNPVIVKDNVKYPSNLPESSPKG